MTTIWVKTELYYKILQDIIARHELSTDTLTKTTQRKLNRLVIKHLTGSALPNDYIEKEKSIKMNGTKYMKITFGALQIDNEGYGHN